jgi:hypothetical protein
MPIAKEPQRNAIQIISDEQKNRPHGQRQPFRDLTPVVVKHNQDSISATLMGKRMPNYTLDRCLDPKSSFLRDRSNHQMQT